jgi:hypothetical protein
MLALCGNWRKIPKFNFDGNFAGLGVIASAAWQSTFYI